LCLEHSNTHPKWTQYSFFIKAQILEENKKILAAFWAVFTFGGSGPAITAHGSLDLKQEIQIQRYRQNMIL
jgi:hypothetical protein